MKTGFEAFGSTQIYLQDYVNNEETRFLYSTKQKEFTVFMRIQEKRGMTKVRKLSPVLL